MNRLTVLLAIGFLFACASSPPPPAPEPVSVAPPTLRVDPSCDTGASGSAHEWNCTGDRLNDAARVREAQRAYRRALGAAGGNTQRAYALGGLAVTSAQLGDCNEAENAVSELRSFAPKNPLSRTASPVCDSLRRLVGP